jgi:hypothetical protein
MTPEEFVHHLPPFANDPVKFKPPFEFKNLSLRVFPLRANLDALQQVCNNYLNFVPPEVGCFRAVGPYAYLALLDYGEISERENSVGWFAQTEVYFGVPVEWYQVVNGKWIFRDWAVITPFIFVDDDFSVPLGRTVFGFPKTLARVSRTASEWLKNPDAPITLASVQTMVFPELYKGLPLESRTFLELERDAPMSNVRLPFQSTGPIAPWVIASRFAEAAAGLGRDVLSLAQSMRIFSPNPWADPSFGESMLNRVLPAFAPGGRGLALNSLNLKQFRNSRDPDTICYQALTNGRIELASFNAGGLLGEECVALGDLTGGYTIKLYDFSSLPIARTLGLEVHRRWRGDGVDVLAFKPVMPFWASLNVNYLAGTNLAWRIVDGIWRGANGAPLTPLQSPPSAQRPPSARAGAPEPPAFNTAVTSAADDANVGPFQFKGVTIRVLPLLAECQILQEFVDTSINNAIDDERSDNRCRLRVWSRPDRKYAYVYMATSSFSDVTSKTNNIGDWAKYELSFLIPVKWERWKPETRQWNLEGVGVVPAFTFVDGTIAAISRTEVLGIPTLHARFVRPSSVWLEAGTDDLDAKQTVLRVDAEVYAALHAGQSATTYPLVEISERDFAGIGEPGSRADPAEWARVLRSERDSKRDTKAEHPRDFAIARALALELLGNPSLTAPDRPAERGRGQAAEGRSDDRVPLSLYTLKQIRDVTDPLKACYQSLVRVPRIFDEVFDLREIDQTLRVRIHEFPSLRLKERLGIVANTVHEPGAGIVFGTQAIRPFYIHATIHELGGECLLRRAGIANWQKGDDVTSSLGDSEQSIKVDLQAEHLQDEGDPCEMRSIMIQSIERRKHDPPKPSKSSFISNEVIKESNSAFVQRALETARTTARTNTEQEILDDLQNAYAGQMAERNEAGADVRTPSTTEASQTADASDEVEKIARVRTFVEDFLEEVLDWERSRAISTADAKDALSITDPQMVIESILSREWGSLDEQTKWRQGLRLLRQTRETALGAGSVPFARFHLQEPLNDATLQQALTQARQNFAAIERALYIGVLRDQSARLGWTMPLEEVEPMIDRMRRFTELRLTMNDYFSVLATWSIAPTLQDTEGSQGWVDDPGMMADVTTAAEELVRVMNTISTTEIIGAPSKDEDPRVLADLKRLRELLVVLGERTQQPNLGNELNHGRSTKIEELFRGQPSDQVWLIDLVREAVQLAGRYVDVQRDALFNKLSRAYQKPDFCIRRDSVSPAERERCFPISQSWDEDWY